MNLKTQVFMGNGDTSLAKVGHLYRLLSEAITLLGLIQQPFHAKTEEEDMIFKDQHDRYQDRLMSIADEMYLGLTGLVPTKYKLALDQGKSDGT